MGTLQVGPHSAGAQPGPACYGQGGRAPTVTDADLLVALRQDREQALAALTCLGLEARAQQWTHTLSGGERRRLEIAILLAQDPQVWLLDEPTNHLDLNHRVRVLELLRDKAADQNRTIIMSLHDPNFAMRYCSHVLMLFGEGCVEQGQAEEMLESQRLSRLYRHPLSMCIFNQHRVFIPE